MNVLVAERDAGERARLCAGLVPRGHQVFGCASASAAVERMVAVPPDVAIVEAGLQPGQPWSLVPALRELTAHVYIIGVIPAADARTFADAWATGLDDVVRRGACVEELAGRVDARRRILAWANRAPEMDFTSFKLSRLAAWRDLDSLVSAELGEMLGETLRVEPGGQPVSVAAEMPVSLAAEFLEIRLGLGVDGPSADVLGRRLFGGPVPAYVLADSLRELANTAAGAFKRAAIPQGQTFTLGLPVSRPAFGPPQPGDHRVSLVGEDFRIELVATRVDLRQRHLCAHDLREGMILAQDLRGASGLLMLAAGTSLTERTVGRIVEMLGANGLVAVADRAGTASM